MSQKDSSQNQKDKKPEKNTPKDSKAAFDPFVYDTVFPEAASVFTFQPQSLQRVKDDCIVVLDASILLLPYSTKSATLNAIVQIYRALKAKSRLIVPAQAAREFAKHRYNKIIELLVWLEQIRDSLGNKKLDIEQKTALINLPEFQDALQATKVANKKIDECRNSLDAIAKSIRDWYWDDPISKAYTNLFDHTNVREVMAQKEKLIETNNFRNEHDIPPGYKDKAKADNGIGDKIIWQTVLEIGKDDKKPVVFVTNDIEKGDIVHSHKKEIVFPRFELVDEFRRSSDGKTLHIIQLSGLMEVFDAEDDAVDDVRNIESVQSDLSRNHSRNQESISELPRYSGPQSPFATSGYIAAQVPLATSGYIAAQVPLATSGYLGPQAPIPPGAYPLGSGIVGRSPLEQFLNYLSRPAAQQDRNTDDPPT